MLHREQTSQLRSQLFLLLLRGSWSPILLNTQLGSFLTVPPASSSFCTHHQNWLNSFTSLVGRSRVTGRWNAASMSVYSLHHCSWVLLWRESWGEGPETTSLSGRAIYLSQQLQGGEERSRLGQSSEWKNEHSAQPLGVHR